MVVESLRNLELDQVLPEGQVETVACLWKIDLADPIPSHLKPPTDLPGLKARLTYGHVTVDTIG